MNKKNRIKILLIVLIIVAAGIVYSCAAGANAGGKQDAVQVIEEETSVPETQTETESEAETVCVYVCGCVRKPGVYYLATGSRIHEAVEQAGGMTENADGRYINLAEVAEDGAQIYIPSAEEVQNGEVPLPNGAESASSDGLVNINTATAEELMTLPGVGESKANAIIAYRENVGAFLSIEEIMNVSGIKESSYEKMKDFIKV